MNVMANEIVEGASYLVERKESRRASGSISPGMPCGEISVRLLNLRWGLANSTPG